MVRQYFALTWGWCITGVYPGVEVVQDAIYKSTIKHFRLTRKTSTFRNQQNHMHPDDVIRSACLNFSSDIAGLRNRFSI
jgi:hypothetical protein